ncbi:MAG: hypothetical protein CUN56_14400 [Phototrophicales bacterium]|nr:MAG: hypothetical protein CUN56_14400 [Phototrophicales bacterium]RMG77135.1 MAG: hypothetical protein D6711_02240 [Chloroflexota bacterium]
MKTKLSIITLLILVMGLMAGVVSAQPGGPGDGPRDPGRPGGRGEREHRVHPIRNAMDTIASELGLTPIEFMELLRDAEPGSTMADVITANGGDVNAIIGILIAQATDQINEAVENERLTQERADELLAELETRLNEMMNRELPDRPVRGRPGDGVGMELAHIVQDWIANNTDLTRTDIREALRDGETFAEILTNAGVDLDAFVADVTAEAQAKLDEAVANGDLTQEQADAMLERFLEGLNNRLSTPADA